MTEIVAFLTARLDEQAQRLEWILACREGDDDFDGGWDLWGEYGRAINAAFDPVRMLRESAAKRELLEWCAEATQHVDWATINQFGSLLHDPNTRATYTAILAMKAMAAPYVDHPDYDPAWRVK